MLSIFPFIRDMSAFTSSNPLSSFSILSILAPLVPLSASAMETTAVDIAATWSLEASNALNAFLRGFEPDPLVLDFDDAISFPPDPAEKVIDSQTVRNEKGRKNTGNTEPLSDGAHVVSTS